MEKHGKIPFKMRKLSLNKNDPIDKNMRESRLKWFGHVRRKTINSPERKSEMIQIEGIKKNVDDDQK